MTTTDTMDRVAEVVRNGLQNLQGRGSRVNEATTRSVLVDRVLDKLGYPPTYRSPEYGAAGNRPDDLCFLCPVSEASGYPALVIETKPLGTSFDVTPGHLPRGMSPDRQIQRYLRSPAISGPNTLGVLTDGVRWRVYRRAEGQVADIIHSDDFDLSDISAGPQLPLGASVVPRLREFVARLSHNAVSAQTIRPVPRVSNLADGLFKAVATAEHPEQIVRQMLGDADIGVNDSLANAAMLDGIRKDAHNEDWQRYVVANGPDLRVAQPSLEGTPVVVGAVEFREDPVRTINRGDVALCARTLASSSFSNAAVVFAYGQRADGTLSARMAASVGRQVNMTAEFDPTLPSPSVRSSIDQQLRLLRDAVDPISPEKLLDPFAVRGLRQQFYREIANWTALAQRGKDQVVREAVLRHLIRVMFVWILKEDDHIPPEIFERAFNDGLLEKLDDYHRDVLSFVFFERLNTHPDVRDEHPIAAANEVLDRAPFLNGSVFAKHQDDDALSLSASDYWGVSDDNPGLFTILARYQWTMDEHRLGESEQTLDPELLSNLFERLIAPTESGKETYLDRQPQGTYYTPADIADEMVKDALASAVRREAGSLDGGQLLDLFGDPDIPLPDMQPEANQRLAARIRELRIFDPAVGSGEFLFSSMLAIRRALKKIDIEDTPDAIIKRQLRGQDINPLAVQIARLRLFIAIAAARKASGALDDDHPLPNLEAVVVCADTLETVADHEWRTHQLDMADPQVEDLMRAIVDVRSRWFDAHSENKKKGLLEKDAELRNQLNRLLDGHGALASNEMRAFAQVGLMADTPTRTDARFLFQENSWRGFDVVIGNPPYENAPTEVQRRATEKLYKTMAGGNLYNLFCETALALANADGGVVALIVPLNIAFGQDKLPLREIFNRRSAAITMRHYDNRPDTPFNASPTVATPENRQRASIIIAVLGDGASTSIQTTGLQRWLTDERQLCVSQRRTVPAPRLHAGIDRRIRDQWSRIPTPEVVDLVNQVTAQSRFAKSYRSAEGVGLAFPLTAYRFLSIIPPESVSPRSESTFWVADEEHRRLMMAALNGHVAYAWWRIFGDGFHVKAVDLDFMTIPDAWVDDPTPAIAMGERLLAAMPDCEVENTQQGGTWRNVDFHTHAPDLIDALDRLHIGALGLPVEPLLTHLRIMRSASSWNYEPAD